MPPDRHERERRVGENLARHLGKEVAGARSGNRETRQPGAPRTDGDGAVRRQVSLEPAQMIILGDARAEKHPLVVAEIGDGEVADQFPIVLQHRRQRHAPFLRQLAGEHPVEPLFSARALDLVFGEGGGFREADALAHRPHLLRDMGEIGRASPGKLVPDTFRCVPERHFQPIGDAELRAPCGKQIVDRRGFQRPPGRQLLVGEADGKAARIVFPHLGVGVGHRGPVAVARHVHRPDVEAGIALDHPVG
jgi:hypothetical protein